MTILSALRAAIFSIICEKTPEGGGADIRPPSVRGLKYPVQNYILRMNYFLLEMIHYFLQGMIYYFFEMFSKICS